MEREMLSAILRLLGVVLTMGVAATVVASLFGAGWAVFQRRWMAARRRLGWSLRAVAVQALALGLGPLMARQRLLQATDELAMCDVDCDLHVGGVTVSRTEGVVVSVRLRSDARRAEGRPDAMRFRVVDSAGHRYAPVVAPAPSPLAPGEQREEQLRFVLPDRVMPVRLEVTWGGWMDFLVPGPEQPLVKRKTAFDLPIVQAS
jgi:hypothetical protein